MPGTANTWRPQAVDNDSFIQIEPPGPSNAPPPPIVLMSPAATNRINEAIQVNRGSVTPPIPSEQISRNVRSSPRQKSFTGSYGVSSSSEEETNKKQGKKKDSDEEYTPPKAKGRKKKN